MQHEEEHLVHSALLEAIRQGRISRRQFLTRMLAAGLGLSGASG